MAARSFALAGLLAFATASQQSTNGIADLEAAFVTEGAACTAGAECDLHLLQVRAQTLSESGAEPTDESSLEKADTATEVEAIEAMKLTNSGSEGIASEEEAIEVMKLPHTVADQEAKEVEVAQEEAIEAMELNPAQKEETESEAAAASADEAVMTSESAGHCTAQDAEAMHRMGKNAFPKAVADCGKSAYKWFRFHQDAMQKCVSQKTGLGAPCASCFAAAGQFGFDNCKVQCLFGSWCSSLCRGCTGAFDQTTQQCVGADVAVPQPDIC